MKGSLTDQPLAELIREITTKGLSGTLRLEQDRARAAVYFEDGRVVLAASNVRTLRLREYLTKRDLVSEQELASLGNNLSDLGLAAALRANGSLRQEDINAVLATLVNDTLRVVLLWTEGSWDFNERARLDSQVRVRVDTSRLLREAAHRLPLKFVSLRFRNPGEIVSRAPDVSGSGDFLPNESSMLSHLDSPINLEQLISVSGLRDVDAYRILYGLTLSGLVTREYWHNAFRTAPATPGNVQTKAPSSPASSVAESGAANNRWSSVNEENDLQLFFDRLTQATNYYQVLDLPLTAEATEIKDAYYALARRYHPDRFHLRSGTPLHTRISSAFARITQAYETLTDSVARSTYDQGLQRSKEFANSAPTAASDRGPHRGSADPVEANSVSGPSEEPEFEGGSDSAKSEYSFKEGFGALQQGRINVAVAHLARASRLAPQQARYRAYYGRALAASEKTRRLAETEIQAAVALEPRNATYRTMLAELYFELKFHRRAQTELDRALALDPNNTTAHSLLRKLESSRKAQ